MKGESKLIAELAEISERIASEKFEEVDFDRIAAALAAASVEVEKSAEAKAECRLLKEDCRKRILGMLKGIVACRPDEDSLHLAAHLTDEGEQLPAKELLKQYRRVAARFRDRFPASFIYLDFAARGAAVRNWTEHKI